MSDDAVAGETHVLIDRASIECVLLDHVDELDDDKGKVDANLAELAYVYKRLTGFDAKAVRAADDQVSDGFGSTWVKCSPTCDLHVVRPGKAQCNCEEAT